MQILKERIDNLKKIQKQSIKQLTQLAGTKMNDGSIVPIRNAKELIKMVLYGNYEYNMSELYELLKCNSVEERFKLSISNKWWASENKNIHCPERLIYDELIERLLEFGGEEVIMLVGDYVNTFLQYGQFWLGNNAIIAQGEEQHLRTLQNIFKYNANQIVPCIGYALSKDGIWRRRIWLMRLSNTKNEIVDTSQHIAYYGICIPKAKIELDGINSLQ